jgi:uncharacterized delta-60 repeat protein
MWKDYRRVGWHLGLIFRWVGNQERKLMKIACFNHRAMKRLTAAFLLAGVLAGFSAGRADELLIPLRSGAETLALDGSGNVIVYGAGLSRLNRDGSIAARTGVSLRTWPVLGIENDGTVLVCTSARLVRIDWDVPINFGNDSPFPASSPRAFMLQPDGMIVVVEETLVQRRHPDGTIDPAFASEPFAQPVPPSTLGAVRLALQEDGKILVAGLPNGLVLRYHADGKLDSSFHAPAIPRVHAMLVQADGKIVIGGAFIDVGPEARKGLVRLNVDGSIDSTFNPVVEERMEIDTLALQANGKIMAGGFFISYDRQQLGTDLVRFYPDGTLDPSFPVGTFVSPARTGIPIALEADGSVLAGIVLNNVSNYLVRLRNPDGATQSLTREGSTLTWRRSGAKPEVYHTRFQASLDGISWLDLGVGKRIEGGWKLEGAEIPEGARFRVRGYVTGTSHYLDFVPETTGSGDPLGLQVYDHANGDLMIGVNSPAGALVLQISTDLAQWTALHTNAPGSHSLKLSTTNLPAKNAFFRLARFPADSSGDEKFQDPASEKSGGSVRAME